jgi:ribosomal protein S18 acetylase RimI-like enzyme
MAVIRPYQPSDRPRIYDICIRTAHQGGDARGVYADPDLVPEVAAGPYIHLEPELAFVLNGDDGDDGAVGYIIGTRNTAMFVRRFRAEWLPLVADRYPADGADPGTPDVGMRRLLHAPERMLVPGLEGYPAHLHINLLPAYQRRGHGRALVDTFVAALRRSGIEALHLGMAPANRGAAAFYKRLGMHVIEGASGGSVTYYGLRI